MESRRLRPRNSLGTFLFVKKLHSDIYIYIYIYILTFSQVFCTGYSACQYGQIHHGAGRHIVAVIKNPRDPVQSQKYAYAAQILLFPALALPKFSICLAYLRIFYTDKRGRRLIQCLMVLLVLLIIPMQIEVALQCNPIHVYWTEGRPKSKCIKDIAGFMVSGSLNIFVDVSIMAVVLPRILELQLHKRQRYALVGIVLLGTLAVVAGIVRMIRVGTMLQKTNFDPSWDSYDVSIWTSTEIYVAVICASAPGIKPFVSKVLPKLLGTSLLSRTRRTGGPSQSYEMGSKWKTIGSNKIQRQTSETALATADGPYTECGRGADAESLGDDQGRPSRRSSSDEGGIYKTSEITVKVAPR